MKDQRGFSLIELLVVISIIGLLSSIILASLTVARNRGADAAIKSNLANARSEAEIFWNNNNTYEVDASNRVCALTGTNVIGDSVQAAESVYDGLAGGVSYVDTTASTWSNAQCHESSSAWVAWVPLRASTSGSPRGFCVDSTGVAKESTSVLAASAYACP